MKSSIEDFGTGWYGMTIQLGKDDIDKLIECLQLLKQDEGFHFHMFSTAFETEIGGIADIEFSQSSSKDTSNMDIGG